MGKTTSSFAKARLLIGITIVGFALFLIETSGSLNFARNLASFVLTPIQYSLYRSYFGITNHLQALGSVGALRTENVELEIENATLEAEASRISRLESENEALRDQLATPARPNKILTDASVIGLGTAGVRGSLLINKGSHDGIRAGDFVVLKNILVGVVAESAPKTSRISLILDPSTKIPAVTAAGAIGLLIGKFGTEVKLENVVQDELLREGDLVMSSGEADFPKGLVLGRIVSVNKVSAELFQEAKVEPLIDASHLKTVFVLRQN